jgi:hypothetical protein
MVNLNEIGLMRPVSLAVCPREPGGTTAGALPRSGQGVQRQTFVAKLAAEYPPLIGSSMKVPYYASHQYWMTLTGNGSTLSGNYSTSAT